MALFWLCCVFTQLNPLCDDTRAQSGYCLNLQALCTHVCALETFQRAEMSLICHVESTEGAHIGSEGSV